MKLIWHIIRKDIARDRWALLLWAALFVAQVVIGLVLLRETGADRDFPMKLQLASIGLVFAEFLVGYVLVVRLVHADLLFGTDMFWATRPMSRGRLLAAKAGAAVLVFGLLPVALLAPWWLWCGFTARDLCWTAVETFGWQLLMIAPAFLLATLTNEFARALMWTILLFIGAMGWTVFFANTIKPSRNPDEPMAVYNGIIYTRLWLSAVLLVVFSTGIAAHHYLTGRFVRSVALTVTGTAVVVAAGLYAPWDWHQVFRDLPRPGTPAEIAAALPLVKVNAGVSMPGPHQVKRPDRRVDRLFLNTEVYFEGLPGETSIETGRGWLAWRWPDGTVVKRNSYAGTGRMFAEKMLRREFALAEPAPDPETAAYQKERADKFAEQRAGKPPSQRLTSRPASQPGSRTLLHSQVPEALLKRGLAESPAFEATLDCAMSRPAVLAELPLRTGAHGGRDSTRARLMWLGDGQDGNKAASLLLCAPAQRQSGLWAVNVFARDWMNPDRGEVWLINRTNGDCIRSGNYSLHSTRVVLVGGVALSWNDARLWNSKVSRGGVLVARDPQWVEHSSLVLVAEEVVARFTTTVRTDRQEFKPSFYVEQTEPNLPAN